MPHTMHPLLPFPCNNVMKMVKRPSSLEFYDLVIQNLTFFTSSSLMNGILNHQHIHEYQKDCFLRVAKGSIAIVGSGESFSRAY